MSAAWPNGLRCRFNDDPDRMTWAQPAPWSRSCVFGSDALQYLSLLDGFEQAANSVDRKLKKSAGTLNHWKLLSRCGLFKPRSSHCNEKCADRPIS